MAQALKKVEKIDCVEMLCEIFKTVNPPTSDLVAVASGES